MWFDVSFACLFLYSASIKTRTLSSLALFICRPYMFMCIPSSFYSFVETCTVILHSSIKRRRKVELQDDLARISFCHFTKLVKQKTT